MTWLLLAWLIAGAWCAFRLVPWGQRTYWIKHLGPTWVSRYCAIGLAVGLLVLLWPLYLWAYWRDPGKDQDPRPQENGPRSNSQRPGATSDSGYSQNRPLQS